MDERITELENKVKQLSIQVEELVLICKKLTNNESLEKKNCENTKKSPKTAILKGLAAYNARARAFPYTSFNIDQ